MTCTHTQVAGTLSSRCLVKAEENSFEYKQSMLLETIITYTFSLRAKLSYVQWSEAMLHADCPMELAICEEKI